MEVYSLWGLPHHRRHTDSGGAPAEEEEPLLEGKAGQRCLEAAASGLDFPRFVEGDFSDVPARRTTSGFRLKVPWHKVGMLFFVLFLLLFRTSRGVFAAALQTLA